MSLKEDVTAALVEYDVRKVVIDREWVSHGVPSTKVEVYWVENGLKVISTCTFDKSLGVDGAHMGAVLSSYMRRGRSTDY